MQSTPDIKDLATALLQAQKFFKKLRRNKVNPHFKSRYADLDACIDCTKPALQAQGLTIIQGATMNERGQVVVVTRLVHAPTGQWIEEATVLPLGGPANPQGAGAAITYARRYGYSAILGITPDDDDDAERSMDRKPAPQQGTAQRVQGAVPAVRPQQAVAPQGMTPTKQ